MEKPNARGSNNFIVGMFVMVALLVTAGFIVFMGGASVFSGEYKLNIRFDDARGLNVGAPVYMSGLLIGRVAKKSLPDDSVTGINISLNITKAYKDRIREDSMASTSTTGMLGDQVVVISPGSDAFRTLEEDEFIKTREVKKLEDYLADGGDAVENFSKAAFHLQKLLEGINETGSLERILKNFEVISSNMSQQLSGNKNDHLGPALVSLKNILEKVDRGEGTLGALINDPTLHEDMRILLGGAKRSQILRFLVREAIAKSEAENQAQADD